MRGARKGSRSTHRHVRVMHMEGISHPALEKRAVRCDCYPLRGARWSCHRSRRGYGRKLDGAYWMIWANYGAKVFCKGDLRLCRHESAPVPMAILNDTDRLPQCLLSVGAKSLSTFLNAVQPRNRRCAFIHASQGVRRLSCENSVLFDKKELGWCAVFCFPKRAKCVERLFSCLADV